MIKFWEEAWQVDNRVGTLRESTGILFGMGVKGASCLICNV